MRFRSLLTLVALGALAADAWATEDHCGADALCADLETEMSFDPAQLGDGRCGTPTPEQRLALYGPAPEARGNSSDCSATSTNPGAYPSNQLWEIPVVFHVITQNDCTTGNVTDELIESQMEILNEDFLALFGTNGGNGTDVQIRFVLADRDPDDEPTTGITRSCNTTWFNDGGFYYNTLAWDPDRYMNIYTNSASGNLGYVPFLPADAGGSFVGGNSDRVVLLWDSVGRDAPIGPPYDQGRTGTHEVGHYLGLEHTFNGGCSSNTPPACYSVGDLICDTNAEDGPTFDCSGTPMSCSAVAPVDNYMDYGDDLCMERFTPQQAQRIRCTLKNWRPDLYRVVLDPDAIFDDDFEGGDACGWDEGEGVPLCI